VQTSSSLTLGLVVILSVGFDFTNGFHDSANAMATTIATGSLRPKVAVGISAVANLVGAFLSLAVAATIAKGIVSQDSVTITVVFAGLVGGIAWNVGTWYLGMPSSSSHALIGGVIGATLVHAGTSAVLWHGVASKVLIPAVLAPVVAAAVAAAATFAAYRLTRRASAASAGLGFRVGQIGTATLVSLAHGTNDAQKTMGVLTLALVANGSLAHGAGTPTWVVLICAVAMAVGTYVGGWRIIRTMGRGLIEIEPPQGLASQAASAAVILSSSHLGLPLSTTQVVSGSIVGSGLGHARPVRWRVFGHMVVTWLCTLPGAATVGAAAYALTAAIGGRVGTSVVAVVLGLFCGLVFVRSRRQPVTPGNVNDPWTASGGPTDDEQLVA